MFLTRNDVAIDDLPFINRLLRVLSPKTQRAITYEELRRILLQPDFVLVSARDERHAYSGAEAHLVRPPLQGMGSVHFSHAFGDCFAYIDDVVKDPDFMEKGIGAAITRELIGIAREHGARSVTLTSSPKRLAANRIYSRFMELREEVVVYHLNFADKFVARLKAFLNFTRVSDPVNSSDVNVVHLLLAGRKAYIGAPVLKRYPPEAMLEMVWIAAAAGAERVEVFTTPETAATAKLLEVYGFARRHTNVYRLLL